MFSLILPSSSKTMSLSGTPNYSSTVGGRRADFSTIASGFPVKVHVQTLLRKTSSSLQSPANSMKHEMDITSAPERKLVKQFMRASNTHSFVADSTPAVNGKYQKLTDDWESKKLDLITGGRLLQDGLVYRQNISVRSFEIGGDRKMSFGALLNHLQVLFLFHFRTPSTSIPSISLACVRFYLRLIVTNPSSLPVPSEAFYCSSDCS